MDESLAMKCKAEPFANGENQNLLRVTWHTTAESTEREESEREREWEKEKERERGVREEGHRDVVTEEVRIRDKD